MRILEIGKSYVRKEYGGNFDKAVEEMDGILFDAETIKGAFANGNGTAEDMRKHMENNRPFCKYYDLEKKCYV